VHKVHSGILLLAKDTCIRIWPNLGSWPGFGTARGGPSGGPFNQHLFCVCVQVSWLWIY